MAINPQLLPEKPLRDTTCHHDTSDAMMFCKVAFIERLPTSLTYTASLQPQDRAVLFYDNLVVAAEYFCAFIEEGVRRQQVTCFTGLDPARYRALFEQVGVSVEELENCGYLRNLSTDDFHTDEEQYNRGVGGRNSHALRDVVDDNPNGARLIHIHNRRDQHNIRLQDLMESERKAHTPSSFPTTSICCYDAKIVLEDAPSEFFTELLKTHDHCVFQGIAMPTNRLLSLQTDTVYPKLRSA